MGRGVVGCSAISCYSVRKRGGRSEGEGEGLVEGVVQGGGEGRSEGEVVGEGERG